MTVETNARFISELNEAYPRNRDLIKEGDDHLRLLKSVLKNTFPGVDSAVLASSEKMNKMDSSFNFEGTTMNITADVKMGSGKTLDMNENRITNVGKPKDPTDAVTVEYLQGAAMWPIGSIFFTADARDPADIFGFGEWEKFAKGRVIIGTGQGVDANADGELYVNGQQGGTYNTKVTTENLPEHTHGLSAGKTATDGAHRHAFKFLEIAKPSPDTKHDANIAQYNMTTHYTETDGDHSHALEGTTDVTGSGKPISTMQPFIACNIWQRTK